MLGLAIVAALQAPTHALDALPGVVTKADAVFEETTVPRPVVSASTWDGRSGRPIGSYLIDTRYLSP